MGVSIGCGELSIDSVSHSLLCVDVTDMKAGTCFRGKHWLAGNDDTARDPVETGIPDDTGPGVS
jgi:hypothetical protein